MEYFGTVCCQTMECAKHKARGLVWDRIIGRILRSRQSEGIRKIGHRFRESHWKVRRQPLIETCLAVLKFRRLIEKFNPSKRKRLISGKRIQIYGLYIDVFVVVYTEC